MIFLTGDTHAEFGRFNTKLFPEQREMGLDDYVIICGDFGGLWNESKEQLWWRKWLSQKPYTTLFIDGNHENFDRLNALPVEEWHGGKTHAIAPNIRHLMRGQVFDLHGLRIFTFGGARSHDIQDGILDPEAPGFQAKLHALRRRNAHFRIKDISWWEQEMPDKAEYAEGLWNLEDAGWKVDVILTHCAPESLRLAMGKHETDDLTVYLEEIRQKCKYKNWYFGHYHDDRDLSEKDHLLYERIVRIV
ncbi:MAG: metallophosphoesterase [Clostridiales bacterium]|nr:metallophosphoesterase [Clostridiales bacterium]